ncbi:aspartate dehydrogenase domain-containing protein [Neorhizobium vignae]|uniref:aspartate dehydrogenase domain-containing protein n=1 Tax=Neorhizobium vignae TaxID=690585 RepID=UPI0005624DDF|nr:aspartate dehydrogenase domain-containing protein [Neorhizobium vignae]
MKRVGVIGRGRIAGPVIEAIRNNGDWQLAGVLARNPSREFELQADAFFDRDYDLIIEAAGPEALHEHAIRALAMADLWTVSGSVLADDGFRQAVERAGAQSGHRLRLLSGSMAGLDGVAAQAAGGASRLEIINQRPGLGKQAGTVFSGSLRDAAGLYPDEVNAAVAVALAGPGINATTMTLVDPGPGGEHRLMLKGDGGFATLDVDILIRPLSLGHLHPVAASIIAALKDATRPIRIG